jgi:non-ribosomal peptide synthetase component E (peptide arylation enzyme)
MYVRHYLTARADAAELADVLRAAGWPAGRCRRTGRSCPEIPKTAVGKFDKKVLRTSRAADELDVERL